MATEILEIIDYHKYTLQELEPILRSQGVRNPLQWLWDHKFINRVGYRVYRITDPRWTVQGFEIRKALIYGNKGKGDNESI